MLNCVLLKERQSAVVGAQETRDFAVESVSQTLYVADRHRLWSQDTKTETRPLAVPGDNNNGNDDEIVCVADVPLAGGLGCATRGGRVLLWREGVPADAPAVAAVDAAGIAACAWSPDGRFCAVLGRTGLLHVLADDLAPVVSASPAVRERLGWRADTVAVAHAAISWRGDSECFSVAAAPADTPNASVQIAVVDRLGRAEAVCAVPPDVALLGVAHAWRPSGDVIAALGATTKDTAPVLLFFERAGPVRHRAPLADTTPVARVAGLAWCASSDLLALALVRAGAPHRVVVQLWATASYVWQQKCAIAVPIPEAAAEDTPVVLHFDAEDAATLRLAVDGTLHTWQIAVRACAARDSPSAACAVVVGRRVALSFLSHALCPPPLAAVTLAHAHDVAAVALLEPAPGRVVVAAQLETGTVVVHHVAVPTDANVADANVEASEAATEEEKGHAVTLVCTTDAVADTRLMQPLLVDAGTLVGAGPDGRVVALTGLDGTGDVAVTTLELGQGVAALAAVPGSATVVLAQTEDATLVACDLARRTTEALPRRLFDAPAVQLAMVPFAGRHTVLALTAAGHLYAERTLVCDRCTSFALHADYVVYTTRDHQLRVLSRALPATPAALAALARAWPFGARDIERGAVVVACTQPRAGAAAVVLQVPRGNLETVCPRALALAHIRRCLDARRYGAAFREARRHRIDLNLLCDHRPAQFLADAARFVRQVRSPDALNVFLTALRPDDVANTTYLPPEAILAQQEQPQEKDKAASATSTTTAATTATGATTKKSVTTICRTLRKALEEESGGTDKYLLCVLTTYAVSDPPELEAALRAAQGVADARARQDALEYLAFLCDADTLADVALGTYDLALARAAAALSQRDPREYGPFLARLAATPVPYRCYLIDVHLQRPARALAHLVAAGPAHRAEVLPLVARHALHRDALRLLAAAGDAATLAAVRRAVADAEAARGRAEQAGLLYAAGGDHARAAAAFTDALCWREAVAAVRRDTGATPAAQQAAYRALAERLEAAARWADAAAVLDACCAAPADALAALCAGRLWLDAWALVCRGQATSPELHDAFVRALVAAVDETVADIADLGARAAELVHTLDTLLATAAARAALHPEGSTNSAALLEGSETASTCATSVWTEDAAGKPVKRRRARRARPSPRLAAVLAAADLCPSAALLAHVGAALRALVAVDDWERARTLQEALAAHVAQHVEPLRARVRELAAAMDRELDQQRLHPDTLAAPDAALVRQYTVAKNVVLSWTPGDWATDFF